MPKLFYTYKDIMEILNYSESKAYEIIKILNNPLSLNSHSDSVGYSKRNDNQHLLYDYQKNNVYYWHGV